MVNHYLTELVGDFPPFLFFTVMNDDTMNISVEQFRTAMVHYNKITGRAGEAQQHLFTAYNELLNCQLHGGEKAVAKLLAMAQRYAEAREQMLILTTDPQSEVVETESTIARRI